MLFVSLTVVLVAVSRSARADREALNAVYQRALYETSELADGMESNLKKASISASAPKQIELLSEAARQSQGAESNLAMLPLDVGQANAMLKFVNQAGDYAQSLSRKIANGYSITREDRAQIELLTDGCAQLSMSLRQLLDERKKEDARSALKNLSQLAGNDNGEPGENAVEYPVLLYDGPFSDGAKGEEWKALGVEILTQEQAQKALEEWIGEPIEQVRFTGTRADTERFYEFEFLWKGQKMYASVSERGGKLTELLSERADFEARLEPETCVEAARKALLSRGFGELKESYYQYYRGLLTVNLAPVENGIILYPDLVKAQVSMEDGSLVGLEAGNYYRNHIEREWPETSISAEMAMSLIDSELESIYARLCLIPIQSREELCYEVRAKTDADEYLIYIDAITGNESVIHQLIPTDTGVLTQ